MMYYIRIRVVCPAAWAEMLIAEMAEVGFDSFMETDEGFEAYAGPHAYDRTRLEEIFRKYQGAVPLAWYQDRVKQENWNELWEKNYEPIVVEDTCLIRASFHVVEKKYPLEITITPKMSFGTGHHATTYLMIKSQLRLDHNGLRVMDAGTGTGILAIVASKRGAAFVEAFDIDDWSLENSQENVAVNGCTNIRIRKGAVSSLVFEEPFDMVLANINKSVLMEEMPLYVQHLLPDGKLLVSGFYVTDLSDIQLRGEQLGLRTEWYDERHNWACLLMRRRDR
jgi:ribosomal protein L11 methyltransferase